jgi:hypothetical protein
MIWGSHGEECEDVTLCSQVGIRPKFRRKLLSPSSILLLASFPIYLCHSYLRQWFIPSLNLHSEFCFPLLDTLLIPWPFSWLILPRLLLVAAFHWFALGTGPFLFLRIFYPEFCCMAFFSTLKMEAASLSEKTANLYHLSSSSSSPSSLVRLLMILRRFF